MYDCLRNHDNNIPDRGGEELRFVRGVTEGGEETVVRIMSDTSPVGNYAFDVTPAR
jgi:methylthioribose-1-phosphate isomerase